MTRKELSRILLPLALLMGVGAFLGFGLVQDVIAGAVLGALITLLGVELRARHDHEIKHRELMFTLRKEVFLEAAEGVATWQRYLGKLGEPAQSYEEIEQLLSFRPAWLQKLEIVASPDTIRAARRASAYHSAASMDLMKQRFTLEKADHDLKLSDEHRKRMTDYQMELYERMRKAVVVTDQKERDFQLSMIEKSLAQMHEAIDKHEQERRERSTQRFEIHQRLAKTAMAKYSGYQKIVVELENSIRQELGIPTVAPLTPEDERATDQAVQKQLDGAIEYIREMYDAG